MDRDAAELGRRTHVDLAVHGDVLPTLDALLPLLKRKHGGRFLDAMLKKHQTLMNTTVGAVHRASSPTNRADPPRIRRGHAAGPDRLRMTRSSPPIPACAMSGPPATSTRGQRRLIGSFLHGSMANALPHAIGAQFAYPGRQVVSVSGDGGLSMLLGELITVAALPAAGERGGVQQLHPGHGQAGNAGGRAA